MNWPIGLEALSAIFGIFRSFQRITGREEPELVQHRTVRVMTFAKPLQTMVCESLN
jgi:hypothetical protein